MHKAFVPGQPTPTEIAVVLDVTAKLSAKGPQNLEFWVPVHEIKVRIDCQYDFSVRELGNGFAPATGLLVFSLSERGRDFVMRIAEAFGGYVADDSLRDATWNKVERTSRLEHDRIDVSRIAVERMLSPEETVALSGLLSDAARLSALVPLLALHAAELAAPIAGGNA